jgi:hypothetical protein
MQRSKVKAKRRIPATKYISPALTVGFTFSRAILLKVELNPNNIADITAAT